MHLHLGFTWFYPVLFLFLVSFFVSQTYKLKVYLGFYSKGEEVSGFDQS